ncbi:MAG: prephenate dehydratase domain-containing protein [Methanomethylophilus sp.]|nr:prephenate dehydratase domain-containing protein [Methanomethylophilus sp.]
MAVRIGYMGIPFSNSEEAAATFAQRQNWTAPILVPLVSAAGVIGALDRREIDWGVLAFSNITAGAVSETRKALAGRNDVETVDSVTVPIHHCIFSPKKGDPIVRLASHPQALAQIARHLKELYPAAVLTDCADTALAAEYLAGGKFPPGTAAVCRRNAGEHYGLYLVRENIEDRTDNMTSFGLVRLRSAGAR